MVIFQRLAARWREWKESRPSRFWKEEDGMGTVEIILIIVVIIALIVVFQDQMKALIDDIFKTINDNTGDVGDLAINTIFDTIKNKVSVGMI